MHNKPNDLREGMFMSHRITISIPDELYKRLQNYKESINISKSCQKELSAEVKRKEDFLMRIKESPDLDDIVKRLKKERMAQYSAIGEMGREDGIDWAKAAHYDDLIRLLSIEQTSEVIFEETLYEFLELKYGLKLDDEEINIFLPIFIAKFPENTFEKNYLEIEEVYCQGFFEGVQEFWEEIRNLLNTAN